MIYLEGRCWCLCEVERRVGLVACSRAVDVTVESSCLGHSSDDYPLVQHILPHSN